MKDSESVEDFNNRVISLVNQLRINGEDIQDRRIVEKILRSLTRKFEYIVVKIEEFKDLVTLSLESLLGSLQSHELRMKQFDSSFLEQAFQTQVSFRGDSRGRGRNGGEINQEYKKDESERRLRKKARKTPPSCMRKKKVKKKTIFLACNVQEVALEETWFLDSGCSNHMTGNKCIFAKLDESLQSEVRTSDDKRLSVRGSGDILVQTKKCVKRISNVFYVPGLKYILLSVGQLLMKGHDVHFKEDVCEIKDKNHILIAKFKSYKLFNPMTKKIFISRDVKFNEEECWNWNQSEKKKKVLVDMDESKDTHDGGIEESEEDMAPPITPYSSPSSSAPSSSSSSTSPNSPPRKTKSIREIYEKSRRIIDEELANFALFADPDAD
ncbi:uncharacterized protein LOC143880706 [Tasmannia lanceolata]|uniref:uncharacterized protein LOC143880706 n=1 Tax=Tasmannia lanceolata TaxID=3420 RepID=UPI0040647BF7